MEIKVLFNSLSEANELSGGWGLSLLIDKRILFDTGEKGDLLLRNIRRLNVDLSFIETVVISHDHWDHTGGLWDILKQRPNVAVYGCKGFSDEFKNKIRGFQCQFIERNCFSEISANIYTTGEIKGEYKNKDISEQSLVIDTQKGLVVITGCAHPGILKILDEVRKSFKNKRIYSVLGGFHFMKKQSRQINTLVHEFKRLGIEKAGPTHCSGVETENVFRDHYREDFLEMNVGTRLII